jgi:serine/threonine-protein kinase
VHAEGVVHRDLTPSNVFVHQEGEYEVVKLVDFGTASLADPEAVQIPDGPPGMVLGTPFYMAPEQACGQATDHRTDLYALGVLLYQMLAGKVPFGATTPREVLYQHVRDEAPAVTSPFEPLPPLVVRIVGRLLRKPAEERYQSASDLIIDLDESLATMARTGWRRWLPL